MPEKPKTLFGVFQRKTGSFTHGEHRFEPLKVREVSADVAEKLNADATPDSPVRFFPTPEKAGEEVGRLARLFDPPKQKA
jgi:hypothetical protein